MFQLFDLKNDTETPARPKKEGKKMEEKARIPKKEEKTEQKKEDVKINKTRHRQNIYVKAIGMIKQVNTMLDTFEGIGLKMDFDDDKTPVGKVMNVMLQNPKDIACESYLIVTSLIPGAISISNTPAPSGTFDRYTTTPGCVSSFKISLSDMLLFLPIFFLPFFLYLQK